MIKLTDFSTAIDTYKKNFLIRKKRFKDTKTIEKDEKRKKRENRIEIGKFTKRVGGGLAKKFKPSKGDFLDNLLRFAAFTVLGLIVANIDKIALALKATIEKLKEIGANLKIFYNEELVPFFENVSITFGAIGEIFGNIADFVIDVNPLRSFTDLLGIIVNGILATGRKIGELNKSPKPKPSISRGTDEALASKSRQKRLANLRSRVSAKQANAAAARSASRSRVSLLERSYKAPSATSKTPTPRTPGSGLSGSKITADTVDIFKKNIDDMTNKPKPKAYSFASQAIDELARRDALRGMADDFLFTPEVTPGTISPLQKLLGKPKETIGIFGKIQNQLSYLTRGLDFRFDIKTPVKNFLKNPKIGFGNLLKGGLTFGAGYFIELGANALGKIISDSLPYEKDFQNLAYFGLISPERIFKLKAEEILSREDNEVNKSLEKLMSAAGSNPEYYDLKGQQMKESAIGVLNEIYKILSIEKKAANKKLKESSSTKDQPKPKVEPKEKFVPPSLPNPNKKANEDNFLMDGTKINIGDTVGSLQTDTTYGSQGVMVSKELTFVIQPVEVPA